MKTNPLFKIIILSLCTLLLVTACNEPKEKPSIDFENNLIPSIQVTTETRFYKLEDRMSHYKVPGIQIAIVSNGKLVWNKGYGISRVDDSISVDSKTLFQAGSISKSITAFTVMKLVEKGVLDLDEDIRTYLKTWKLPDSKFTQDTIVTLRMLLSHTSGMNNSNHPGFPQNEYLPKLNELLNGYERYKGVNFDTIPNARYRYSNTGYAVIQKIIEDVTNQSFNIVTKDEVFEPLGMQNSYFYPFQHDDEEQDISYAYNREGKLIKGYWFNAATLSSGGLWTTAEDLSKFLIAFQDALDSETKIISETHAHQMITRVKANYGLGFDLKNKKDSLVFYHTGKNRGFTNIMMASKKGKNAVVVLTNGDNGGYLFSEVIRGISKVNNWDFMSPKNLETINVSIQTLKEYEGTYKAEIQGTVYSLKVILEGKHLQLIDLDENNKEYPLRAISETKFIDINDGEKIDFINKNDTIVLLWNGEYEFDRVKE